MPANVLSGLDIILGVLASVIFVGVLIYFLYSYYRVKRYQGDLDKIRAKIKKDQGKIAEMRLEINKIMDQMHALSQKTGEDIASNLPESPEEKK